jgi:hypothetical protein
MSQGTAPGPAADVVEFDGRRGWSRRTWVVALTVLGAVLGAAWVWQDRARAAVEAELATCATGAEAALQRQDERFEYMADYLRPALIALPVEGRDSLYALMARTASESVPRVREALDTCRGVQASWVHRDLRSRRDALVEHLAATVTVLQAIEEDGREYYRDTPELDAQRDELFPAS